jgi:hypothetical protein
MAQPGELERVAERRRILVAESDLLRSQIAAEVAALENAAGWVDRSYSLLQNLRSWWPLAAAAAGLMLGRSRGGLLKKIGKVWSLWKLVKKATSIWRQFHSATGEGQPERASTAAH